MAAVFVAYKAVANYCDATMFKLGRRMGIRSRSALISAVFRKAMVLDMSSANAGQLQVSHHPPLFFFNEFCFFIEIMIV